MLNVTLNDKTAKQLEAYRRSKRLSREKALEVLLEEVTQRQAMQQVLEENWQRNADLNAGDFEEVVTDIVRQDRAKQRARGSR